MRLIFSLSLIIMFSTAIACGAQDVTNMNRYLIANQHEYEGNYEKAINLYKEILKEESSPMLYIKIANAEYMRGNGDEAYEFIKKGEDKYPDRADIAFNKGIIASELAVYEKNPEKKFNLNKDAKNAFVKASKIEPNERNILAIALVSTTLKDYKDAVDAYNRLIKEFGLEDYYSSLGMLKIDMGDKKGGMADLERAAKSNNVQALIRLADISLKNNEPKAAYKYLLEVSKLQPGMLIPDMYLADYYAERKENQKAMEHYLKASESLSGSAKVKILKQIGSYAVEIEDYPKALEVYELALKEDPNDSQLYYFAGYIASTLDPKKAEKIYTEGLTIFPDYAILRKNAAVNYLKMYEPRKSIDTILHINKDERDLEYYLILGNAYNDVGDFDASVKAYSEGLKKNPKSVELYVSLAFQYDKAKSYDKCIDLLKKGLVEIPDSPVLQNFLGYVYADLNRNLDEATELIDKALDKDPENYAYIDSKAWVEYRKGNYNEAYKLIRQAMDIYADDEELIKHYEEIKKKVNENKK